MRGGCRCQIVASIWCSVRRRISYVDSRLYLEGGRDLGIARGCAEWVEWMLAVTTEALRVSRGAVLWVATGKTEDRSYWPACEGLMWEWWRRGLGTMYRPCYWKRSGIPGSGGDQWFRADVEYVMCFKRPGPLPWTDNTAMGEKPKYPPGGKMTHRLVNGKRKVYALGRGCGGRRPGGGNKGDESWADSTGYAVPDVANHGNLIDTGATGGGNLGSIHAHESEAPFPEALAEFFVASLCPPGGRVLDPFSGSGTTVAVAERLGRVGIGMDLRRSQALIARRRITRPHSRPAKAERPGEVHPLFDGGAVGDTFRGE